MKSVSKPEFWEFVKNYPRKLEMDIYGVCDPPVVTFNDFSLGVWPKSVVARTWKYDDDPDGHFYEPEENRKYYIECDQPEETPVYSGVVISPGNAYEE